MGPGALAVVWVAGSANTHPAPRKQKAINTPGGEGDEKSWDSGGGGGEVEAERQISKFILIVICPLGATQRDEFMKEMLRYIIAHW